MNISIKCLGDFNLPKDCLTRLVGQQKMGRPEKPESVDFWLHDIRTNEKPFGRLSVVQCDGYDVLAIVTNADHAPEHATLLEESAYMKWDRKFHVYGQVVLGAAWSEDSSRTGRHGTQRVFLFGYNLETGYSRKGKGTCKGEAPVSFEGGVRREGFGYTQFRSIFIDLRLRHYYGMSFEINGYMVNFTPPRSAWVRACGYHGGYNVNFSSELQVKLPDNAVKKFDCGDSWEIFKFLGELCPEANLLATVASYPSKEIDAGIVQGVVKLLGVPNPPMSPARTPLARNLHGGAHGLEITADCAQGVKQEVTMNSLAEAFDWSRIKM